MQSDRYESFRWWLTQFCLISPSPRDDKESENSVLERVGCKVCIQKLEIRLLIWAPSSFPHWVEISLPHLKGYDSSPMNHADAKWHAFLEEAEWHKALLNMTFSSHTQKATGIQRQNNRGRSYLKHGDGLCRLISQQNPTQPCYHSGK